MKNLAYHKKQLKQHRARNAFNAWTDATLNEISERIRIASDKRWANLKQQFATLQK